MKKMPNLKSSIWVKSQLARQIQALLYQTWLKTAKKYRLNPKTIKKTEILVEHPENEDFGDFSSNLFHVLIFKQKTLSKTVKLGQFFKDFCQSLIQHSKLPIAKVYEKGSFLNISIKKDYFLGELQIVLEAGEKYGSSNSYKNKRIMVEYAHPNTHKQFHLGHLRNIILGESIARILKALGAEVIRVNYQGDVGLHIAKCLWAIRKSAEFSSLLKDREEKVNFRKLEEKLAENYVVGNQAYETDKKARKEIKHINSLIYAGAQKLQQEKIAMDYTRLIRGDKASLKEIYQLWKITRQWSLDYFSHIYRRVYTKFNRLYFESECLGGVDLVEKALEKGILKKSKGAVVFDGKPYGLDVRVFINSLGLPTYEGKELKLAEKEFSDFGLLDKNIHVVSSEQISFFKVTFKVEELLDPEKYQGRQYHLIYGWVRLKKGKMSSRLGNVVLGEDILDEAEERIRGAFSGIGRQTAEMVAVGAVKYSFLKTSPKTDVVFDFQDSISLQGNSGPYLQYTYARCKSVLAKAGTEDLEFKTEDLELNQEEENILRFFYRFPEVVEQAGEQYSPNLICNFLYDLAQKYNVFYNKHRILTGKLKAKNNFRLLLTAAVAQILKNGLYLLGIKSPERM